MHNSSPDRIRSEHNKCFQPHLYTRPVRSTNFPGTQLHSQPEHSRTPNRHTMEAHNRMLLETNSYADSCKYSSCMAAKLWAGNVRAGTILHTRSFYCRRKIHLMLRGSIPSRQTTLRLHPIEKTISLCSHSFCKFEEGDFPIAPDQRGRNSKGYLCAYVPTKSVVLHMRTVRDLANVSTNENRPLERVDCIIRE